MLKLKYILSVFVLAGLLGVCVPGCGSSDEETVVPDGLQDPMTPDAEVDMVSEAPPPPAK